MARTKQTARSSCTPNPFMFSQPLNQQQPTPTPQFNAEGNPIPPPPAAAPFTVKEHPKKGTRLFISDPQLLNYLRNLIPDSDLYDEKPKCTPEQIIPYLQQICQQTGLQGPFKNLRKRNAASNFGGGGFGANNIMTSLKPLVEFLGDYYGNVAEKV